MPSLKEVKNRIASVNSTRKITSAMKMVSSSKLHKSQQAIENMRPYEERLNAIMSAYAGNIDENFPSPLLAQRDKKRVALVVITSNSSLCGGFNNNVVKAFQLIKEKYSQEKVEIVRVYAFGKKGYDSLTKLFQGDLRNESELVEHPSYERVAAIAQELCEAFIEKEIDEVKLLFHHFHSNSKQVLTEERFLPVEVQIEDLEIKYDYLVEPSPKALLQTLMPKSLNIKLYAAVLDSIASEHAARVIAMQTATDNADDLLQELTLTYNKTRQQAITTELLDLVGGSMQ